MSAGALAVQTDVVAFTETLKADGARILPEVWHHDDATTRHISSTAVAGSSRGARAKSGRAATRARSGSPIAGARSGTTEQSRAAGNGDDDMRETR